MIEQQPRTAPGACDTGAYTPEDARRRPESGGENIELIRWTPAFRRMIAERHAPVAFIDALKSWEALPVPTHPAQLAAYRFVNEALPAFWDAAVGSYGPRTGAATPRVPLHHWKRFWTPPAEVPAGDLMDLMRKVAHAQLAHLNPERPTAVEVAGRIGPHAQLTDICVILLALDEYATGARGLTARDDYQPVAVAAALDSAGVRYVRNIIPLGTPQQLREGLGWLYSNSVVCSGCRMVVPLEFTHRTRMGESFYINETDFSLRENYRHPVTDAVCRLCYGLYGDDRPYQGPFIGAAERAVFESIGADPATTPDVAAAAAHMGGFTRSRVDALLRGIDPGPETGAGEQCPLAGSCDTFCGRAQRDSEEARPFTADGTWESCGYADRLRHSDARTAAGAPAPQPEAVEEAPETPDGGVALINPNEVPKEQMALL